MNRHFLLNWKRVEGPKAVEVTRKIIDWAPKVATRMY